MNIIKLLGSTGIASGATAILPQFALVMVVIVGLLGWYVNHQDNVIDDLNGQIAVSENNNNTLNDRIISQNESIKVANAKYIVIQHQLDAANGQNRALAKEINKLRVDINDKPVPATCKEATSEMIQTGKGIGAQWDE